MARYLLNGLQKALSSSKKEVELLLCLLESLTHSTGEPSKIVKAVNLLSFQMKRLDTFLSAGKVVILKAIHSFNLELRKAEKSLSPRDKAKLDEYEQHECDLTAHLADLILQVKSYLTDPLVKEHFVHSEIWAIKESVQKAEETLIYIIDLAESQRTTSELQKVVELLLSELKSKELSNVLCLLNSDVSFALFSGNKEFQESVQKKLSAITEKLIELLFDDRNSVAWEEAIQEAEYVSSLVDLELAARRRHLSKLQGRMERRASLPLELDIPESSNSSVVHGDQVKLSTSFLDAKSDSMTAIQDLIMSLCDSLQTLLVSYSNNLCLEVIMNASVLESMVANSQARFSKGELSIASVPSTTKKPKDLGLMWGSFQKVLKECKEEFNSSFKAVMENPDCCNRQLLNRSCVDFLDTVLNLYHLSQHLHYKKEVNRIDEEESSSFEDLGSEASSERHTSDSPVSRNGKTDSVPSPLPRSMAPGKGDSLPMIKEPGRDEGRKTPVRGHKHSNSTSAAYIEDHPHKISSSVKRMIVETAKSVSGHSLFRRTSAMNSLNEPKPLPRRLSIHQSIEEIVKEIEENPEGLLYEESHKSKHGSFADEWHFLGNGLLPRSAYRPKCLKGGTIDRLIDKMTWFRDSINEPNFVNDFVYCFHLFCLPDVLFDKLEKIYRFEVTISLNSVQEPYFAEQIVQRVRNKCAFLICRVLQVLKRWIEIHGQDFTAKDGLGSRMRQFADDSASAMLSPNIASMKHLSLGQPSQHDGGGSHFGGNPFLMDAPAPLIPKSLDLVTLFTVDPLELARQQCLIDFFLLQKIPLCEFLTPKDCPNISNLIQRFNFVTQWVVTEILCCHNLKERARAVKQFIKTAQKCLELQNFNCLNAILAGLQSASVHRLKKTWQLVSKKRIAIYDELSQLMTSEDNYKNLRIAWENVRPPCIPWIGLYQRDITFLMDAHPTYLKEHPGFINVAKLRLLFPILKQISDSQKESYRFHNVVTVHKYLHSDKGLLKTENDQFKVSLLLEPRDSQ